MVHCSVLARPGTSTMICRCSSSHLSSSTHCGDSRSGDSWCHVRWTIEFSRQKRWRLVNAKLPNEFGYCPLLPLHKHYSLGKCEPSLFVTQCCLFQITQTRFKLNRMLKFCWGRNLNIKLLLKWRLGSVLVFLSAKQIFLPAKPKCWMLM